ncbi:hypothetical protein SAMN05216323_11782 [Williamwhitmania taraxaci]|uniref:Uncharacterized protein n=1 Tax=Williamwhitmania taraxaci TaxID=1640674 RepID=A0A1G6UI61_9BACT|nr:hypothetical protein SAMN05216323_11782 [Williamwhitmania taraxaci]
MIIITGVPDYFMLLCCGYKVISKYGYYVNYSQTVPSPKSTEILTGVEAEGAVMLFS